MFKNRVQRLIVVALVLGLLLAGQSAKAAWTWDYNSSGTGLSDSSGTWNTTSLQWFTGNVVAESAWSVSQAAQFGGSTGTTPFNVSLGGGSISANGVVFQNQAYTISNGSLNLTGVVTVNSPSGGTIGAAITTISNAPLFLTGRMTKAGPGTLTITNSQTSISSATLVQNGTLVLAAGNNILSSSLALTLGGIDNNTGLPTNGTVDLAGFSQRVGSIGTNGSTTPAFQTISNSVAATTATLTITGSGASTSFGGSIQDGAGQVALNVTGGVVILAGANTYSGSNAISGGTLEALTTAALPGYSTSGNISMAASATLAVRAGGFGQWAASDIDTLRANGLSATNINLGIDTSDGSFAYPSNIANGAGGALSLVKLGANTLTLSGSNTYTGKTVINGGVLSLANSAALSSGAGAITFAGGSLQYTASSTISPDYSGRIVNSTSAIGIDLNGQSVNFASGLASSNTGGLTLNSTVPGGILNLAASNGYSGATRIGSGVLLSVANSAALSSGAGAITFAGGTLRYTASNNVDYSSRIASSTGSIAIDLNGQSVTFASGLPSSNTGGLTLNSTAPGGKLTLAASNGYTGTTLVSGGTLLLANSNAISALSTLDTSGSGSISFGGLTSATFGGLQGSGNLALSNTTPAGVTLTVGSNNISTTYSGQLSGGGSLTKAGSGLLYLSGANSYTGTTTITAGMLQATTTAALPGWSAAGNVSVAASATLAVNAGAGPGQWTVGNIDTLRGVSGLFAANANLGIDISSGSLTYPSNITNTPAGALGLTILGSNTLLLTGSNTYTGNTTISGGVVQLGSSTALYSGVAAGNLIASNGTLDLSGNTVTLATISGSGAVTDSIGTASLTVGNANNSTFTGSLQIANLTKNGAGLFVLGGANNTTTSTTITGGTLQIGNGVVNGSIGNNGNMGSGAYVLTNNARLFISQGSAAVASLPLSSITGSGIIELKDAQSSGSVLYSALTSSNSLALTTGTLQVEGRGVIQATPAGLGGVNAVVVNSSGQFWATDGGTSGAAYTYTQNFSIAGAGSSFNGGLRVRGMNANFSGSIALTANATLWADAVPGTALNVSGVISGAVGSTLTINDTGYPLQPIIFTAANTYSGPTAASGSWLQLSNSAAMQNSTLSSGSLAFDSVGAGTASFTLGGLSGGVVPLTGIDGVTPIALSVGNNNSSTAYAVNLSGLGSLTKIGSGNLTYTRTATYAGPTTISGGTLTLATNTGALIGGMLPVGSNIVDNGTLVFSRTGFLLSGNPNAFGNVIQGVDFSSAGISGSGSLVQAGTGNLVLNASNTYTGATKVNAGTLTVNGSLAALSAVTVAASATLAGSGSVLGATTVSQGGSVQGGYNNVGSLSLGSLTFAGTSNTYAALGASTSSPAPIMVNGALTHAGSNIYVNIAGLPVTSGTYSYLQYGSLVGTGGTAAFKLSTPVRAVSLVSTGNTLGVAFDALQYPIWTGSNSTAFSGGTNWKLALDNSPTDFQNLDAVVFDDSAVGPNYTVNISGSSVTPYSTTFNNSSLPYTLTSSGSGGIGGIGSLTKNGTAGLLTIANSTNSYTGGTFVNGGTLALGINNGLPVVGTVAGALTLGSGTSNGTFNLAGYNQSLGTLAVGAGAAAANQVITTSIGTPTLTFSGNNTGSISTFGGTIGDSAPSGGTLGLTVSSGTLDLSAGNPIYHGVTYIQGGVLKVSSLPNTSSILNSGALAFVGSNTNISAPITNNGQINYSGGSGTLSGLIQPALIYTTLGPTLNVGGGALTISGSASFPYRINVFGGGTLIVASGGSLNQIASDSSSALSVGFGSITTPGNLVIAGGTATLQVPLALTSTTSSESTLTVSNGVLQVGYNPIVGGGGIGGDGYISVSGGLLSITTSAVAYLGTNSIGLGDNIGGGTMGVSGGTVSADGNVIFGSVGAGVFNQSGGLVTCGGSLSLGYLLQSSHGTGGGTMNLGGGTLDLSVGNGNLYNGYANSSTVNISGSATAIVPTFNMGYGSLGYSNSAIVNTLNLNGGTLQTGGIFNSLNNLDTNTVNFNGGLLAATANNLNFLSGMTNAFVLAGRARINDGGNQIAISQNLQSGAGLDGGLTKSGAGLVVLSGSNTYNGGTNIQEGVLQLGNSAALGTGGLVINGGTLDMYGNSVIVAGLSGGTAGAVSDYGFSGGTTTLTVNQSTSTTFGGQIVDGAVDLVALSVTGGSLTLSGTNTYTGGTTVAGGELIVTNSQAIADGTSLTVGNPSAFAPVVPSSGGSGLNAAIAPVPEPGTLALLAAVLGGAAVYRRFRRRTYSI